METVPFFLFLFTCFLSLMCVYPSCLHPPTMGAWQGLLQTGCYWKTDAWRDCSGLTPGMLKSFQADQLGWKTSLSMGEGNGGGGTPPESFPSAASWSWPPPTPPCFWLTSAPSEDAFKSKKWFIPKSELDGPFFLHQDPPPLLLTLAFLTFAYQRFCP